jgi:VWFA-related protein
MTPGLTSQLVQSASSNSGISRLLPSELFNPLFQNKHQIITELRIILAVSKSIILLYGGAGMTANLRMRTQYLGWMLLLIPSALFGQQESQTPQIRVQVNLVSLDVEVLDKNNNLVLGLAQPDFIVEENGKRMEISHFALSIDRPVSLAVVLDTSGLSTRQLGICKTFLHTIAHKLDRSDQLCFYTVDLRDAYLEQAFTADRPLLIKALDNIGVPSKRSGGLFRELFGAPPPMGLAIDLALQKVGETHHGKKALLVISNRFRGLGPGTVDHIQQSDCTLLTLAFPRKASMAVAFGDAINTSQLMRESGGRQFSAESRDIEQVCRQIAHSLKNYYSIGYLTQIAAGDTKPRKISIGVPGRDYRIHFRHTYIPQ